MNDLQVELQPPYPVRLWPRFAEAWQALREDQGHRPWFVVVDARLLERNRNALDGLSGAERRRVVTVRGGEGCKSPAALARLQRMALERHLDRQAVVVAVGGGSVGDLAGFLAATWMRGVDWCPFATTSLAMADSAIGGKTAINMGGVKNLVGSFHQPVGVYGAVEALRTLPARHRRAGLAEVVKMAVIASEPLFASLEASVECLDDPEDERWLEVLRAACEAKAAVVAEDPREEGRRAVLNFGHTLGHALEVSHRPRLLHGEAVALGMIAATWISEFQGPAPTGTFDRVVALLERARLPRRLRELDLGRFWNSLSYDKKGTAGESRMVLTSGIGSATFDHRVRRQHLQAALRRLLPRDRPPRRVPAGARP